MRLASFFPGFQKGKNVMFFAPLAKGYPFAHVTVVTCMGP